MSSFKTLKAMVLSLAALALGWSGTAFAQAATCGITGSASASPTVYDPFNPSGLATTTITLNLTRVNTSGGGDTRIVNFYLKANPAQNTGLDGTSIVPTAVTGSVSYLGTGLDIFYDYNQAPPVVSPTNLAVPSGANQFLQINFTGNNSGSDTATVTFNVTLPANLAINASTSLAFDAYFGCNIQGGQSNGLQQTGSFSNAVVFPITVLSALQASFVGTALDFQEIGDVDNVAAPTHNTGTSSFVRVQSSGAYTVAYSSQNAFRMKHPTGSLANATDRIAYKVKFLGQERDNTTTPGLGATALTQQCAVAGIGVANEDQLYIMATLQEGGAGKTPSLGGNYQDILTVTVTPAAIAISYPQDCTAFTVP